MANKTEILYSLDRRVRVVKNGPWYQTEVSHVRGRWGKVSQTRKEKLVPAMFNHELNFIEKYYPSYTIA